VDKAGDSAVASPHSEIFNEWSAVRETGDRFGVRRLDGALDRRTKAASSRRTPKNGRAVVYRPLEGNHIGDRPSILRSPQNVNPNWTL